MRFVHCSATLVVLSSAMCMCVAAQSAAESDDSDIQPIHDFRVQILATFHEQNFQQLEQIAASAASEKSRFQGGQWKLNVFYTMLQGPGSLTASEERWKLHFERLQRWADAMPSSAVPRIALARAYERYAWKARGNGWANTVTDEGWKAFHDRIQQARTILEQAQSLPNRDPQWFVDMQIVALAQSWSNSDAQQLAAQASATAPDYFYIYTQQIEYLLPKWHGKPGDATSYLNQVADGVGGPEGDFIYFRCVSAYNTRSHPELPNTSWDRVKRGFAAVEDLYKSTNHERNQIAFLALQNGDKEFASQMFARIGSDWDETVWHGKANFDSARSALVLSTSN